MTSSSARNATRLGDAHRVRSALIAGVISGEVGLLVFLIIHHFWIVPIWFILPAGALVACCGGLAVGWSYAEIRRRFPSARWKLLAGFGLMATTLAPAIVLAQILPPVVDVGAARLVGATNELLARFVFALVVPATLVGALEGWALLRTWRGAAAMALAGLLLALVPGHNIPFLGRTPAVGKELSLLTAVALASSVTLAKADEWLERYQARGEHS
jgi:hypothetical protein